VYNPPKPITSKIAIACSKGPNLNPSGFFSSGLLELDMLVNDVDKGYQD